MKISTTQFNAVQAALERVLTMTQPADAVLAVFFRAHRQLGRDDRAFVSKTVFEILRHRLGLEYHSGAESARQLLIAHLTRTVGISLRQIAPLLKPRDMEWAGATRSPAGTPPLYVRCELPPWLVERLSGQWSEEEILKLGRALRTPAPLDLRVNTLLATRDTILAQLKAEGLPATATPHSPVGIRIAGRPSITRHPLLMAGKIEVQDEGSQLLALLLEPRRREMVVDFCAGAGGKTLMLGALMQSTGRIYAFDVSRKRLDKLTPRLGRSSLSNVHPQALDSENDSRIKRLAGKIDRVLVDAPCSGFGTLRRNPDLKWRQSPESIAELSRKQGAILNAAARLLKPGGRLVYATCSFLREENEDVIAAFLASHPDFSILPADEVLRNLGIALCSGEFFRLYPHHHGCDGFFAAILHKVQKSMA